MAQEKQIVSQKIRRIGIEEFLSKEFTRAGYSHSEIQRTPLALRITVFAHKPGIVIGRGGKNIENITRVLKEKFGLENPQLDVQEVENPDLDASIVSKQIAAAIERGLNYKRIVNMTIQRIMESGAVGVAIRLSGKVSGEMSRTEKFSAGYLKYAGEPAEELDKSYARAQVKLGTIGIQVRILKDVPKEIEFKRIVTEKARERAVIMEAQAKIEAEKAAIVQAPEPTPVPAPAADEAIADEAVEEAAEEVEEEIAEEAKE
jgi:small subunit ribosomal protein S3